AAAEQSKDHSYKQLQAQQIQNDLRLAQWQLQMEQSTQRNQKNTAQQQTHRDKHHQQNEQSARLQMDALLHLATVVVDGHLHIGVSLYPVVERREIADGSAQRKP